MRRRNRMHAKIQLCNIRKLKSIRERQATTLTLRVASGPAPLLLQSSAEAAASLQDLRAQVTDAGQATRAVSLWDELRVWDPGD